MPKITSDFLRQCESVFYEYPSDIRGRLRAVIEFALVESLSNLWHPISIPPPPDTVVLAYWPNGEMHTGSTDGTTWHPLFDTDRPWSMPTHWTHLPENPTP